MDDLLKRRGKFTISGDVIRGAKEYGSPLFRLFAKMIVVRAECDFMTDSVEYYAYSPMFRPIEAGEATPRYIIQIDTIYVNDQIKDYRIFADEVK